MNFTSRHKRRRINPKEIKLMDKEKIETALISALSLLNNELQCVELDELRDEYLAVIEQLETALKELSQNG